MRKVNQAVIIPSLKLLAAGKYDYFSVCFYAGVTGILIALWSLAANT